MGFIAILSHFYLYYIILKFSERLFFYKKAEKSGSTGASGANWCNPAPPKQENQKLPAKGARPSAGSKIHFKL